MNLWRKMVPMVCVMLLSGILQNGCGLPAEMETSGMPSQASPDGVPSSERVLRIFLPGEAQPHEAEVMAEIGKRSADVVGCRMEVAHLAWEDYLPKINMMAAASEKFDLFLCFSGELPKMVARNFIRPLDTLLGQYGANLVRVIPRDELDALRVDGRLYGIPSVYPRVEIAAHAIRGDLRLKYGLPEIDRIEDLEVYLQTMKDKEGIIPYAADMGNLGGGLGRAFMGDIIEWYWGDDMTPYIRVDWTKKDMRVESNFSSDITMRQMQWNRKAYRNGWFPKDILTMQKSGSLFVTGKAAVVPADLYNLQELDDKLRSNVAGGAVELVTFQKGKTHAKIGPSNNFACISASGENQEAAMRFLDWIRASQENYDLYMYGRPGLEYEQVGGKVKRLRTADVNAAFCYAPMPWLTRDFSYERLTTEAPDVYVEALNVWKSLPYAVCPIGGFTVSNADFQKEQAQLITLIREQWLPIFVGYRSSDEEYRRFLDALDEAGLQKIIRSVQRQLDAYLTAGVHE